MNCEAVDLFMRQFEGVGFPQAGVLTLESGRIAFVTDMTVMAIEMLAEGAATPDLPSGQLPPRKTLTAGNLNTALTWGAEVDPVAVDGAVFADWLGAPDWSRAKAAPESCAACEGDGLASCQCSCGNEHERTCDECDGSGKALPDHKQLLGNIDGYVFDRNRLAQALAVVCGALPRVVTMRLRPNREDSRLGTSLLRIDGDGWRVVLQGIIRATERGPSLELPTVEARP
jgi:hypothetical protein